MTEIAEKLMNAFFTSRLDYCNSLPSGLPPPQKKKKKSIKELQLGQNVAARVLTHTQKKDRIIPAVLTLHWLPVGFELIGSCSGFKTVLKGLATKYWVEWHGVWT